MHVMRRDTRLTTDKEYGEVYSRGRSVANRELALYFLKKDSDMTRAGISISRRIGSAVVRNRIKRLIRESFRKNEARIKAGYDLVFIARQAARGKSFHGVEKAFIDVLSKAELLKEERR